MSDTTGDDSSNADDYKKEFYQYGQKLGIKINDLQRLMSLAKQENEKQAIAFAKFLDDLKINADKYFNVPKTATTEELYNLFQQENNLLKRGLA